MLERPYLPSVEAGCVLLKNRDQKCSSSLGTPPALQRVLDDLSVPEASWKRPSADTCVPTWGPGAVEGGLGTRPQAQWGSCKSKLGVALEITPGVAWKFFSGLCVQCGMRGLFLPFTSIPPHERWSKNCAMRPCVGYVLRVLQKDRKNNKEESQNVFVGRQFVQG